MNDIVKTHRSSPGRVVTFTKTAQSYVMKRLAKSKNSVGVRLSIDMTGCSGMSYVFDVTENIIDTDLLITEGGINLYVDHKSVPFIKGTVIDYVLEGLNKKIIFHNPNAKNSCGCGESFSVDGT